MAQRPGRTLELCEGVHVARRDLWFTFVRSPGPGGQAVNKVATRARLRLPVAAIRGLSEPALGRLRRLAGRRLTAQDELLLVSSAGRSQAENRRACLERLRRLVERSLRAPAPRRPTRPAPAAVQRRLQEKKRRSDAKRRRRRPGAEDL
jgi:ribosome-associated protein